MHEVASALWLDQIQRPWKSAFSPIPHDGRSGPQTAECETGGYARRGTQRVALRLSARYSRNQTSPAWMYYYPTCSRGTGKPHSALEAPIEITRSQMQQALDAFLSAFTYRELEQLFYFELNRDLDEIVSEQTSFAEACFVLLRRAEREGWIEQLIRAAVNYKPRSEKLRLLVQDLDLEAGNAESTVGPIQRNGPMNSSAEGTDVRRNRARAPTGSRASVSDSHKDGMNDEHDPAARSSEDRLDSAATTTGPIVSVDPTQTAFESWANDNLLRGGVLFLVLLGVAALISPYHPALGEFLAGIILATLGIIANIAWGRKDRAWPLAIGGSTLVVIAGTVLCFWSVVPTKTVVMIRTHRELVAVAPTTIRIGRPIPGSGVGSTPTVTRLSGQYEKQRICDGIEPTTQHSA